MTGGAGARWSPRIGPRVERTEAAENLASIVIAAHNEALVIGRTLDAILDGGRPQEVIVVANGCHDDTAGVARDRGVRVLELVDAGKAAALNAGDAVATRFPRIYLDADIVVPAGGLERLTTALDATGALVAVPGRRVVTEARPWPVRAYYSISQRLPAISHGLYGRGLIAVSEEGRGRFDAFPAMVADDLFLDSLFSSAERTSVPGVEVIVETPHTTRALVRRLVRVRRGNAEMRAKAGQTGAPARVRPADRWSWLRDVVLPNPGLLPAGAAYVAISVLAAVGARLGRRSSLRWGSDESTRQQSDERPRGDLPRRVGLMGVQCDTANLGLAALAYSAVSLLDDLVPRDTEIVLFSRNSPAELARMGETLGVATDRLSAVPFRHRSPAALRRSAQAMSTCDAIVDFTGGDSFSDIYGMRRITRKLADKQMVIGCGVPLVLAPQTIGPFRNPLTLPWVKHVLRRAALVCTRDDLSGEFVTGLTQRAVIVATDVAVMLPSDASHFRLPPTDRARVGLNVSGLLWNGGYTGRNQFNLRTDYRAFCRGVVEGLLEDGLEVHLVPHVLSRGDADDEDDVAASEALAAGYPDVVVAPRFASPVEAKSYIHHLDAFIGSRMHATIAAFTSGVPTIPVAYSRKFAGFFGSLSYPVLVDLTTTDTGPAVDAALRHVREREALRADLAEGNRIARERSDVFTTGLAEVLSRR